MKYKKKWAKRILATFLAALLVLVNDSMVSFAENGGVSPKDYEDFRSTEANPIIVEVAAVNFDRGEGAAFPIIIGSASGENVIDGGDRMKARVSGTSVTLSWSAENRPTQICIEGDPDWDIRDIGESATSITVDFQTGRDFYYIEAKYGNDFDNFGPTEENPTIVQIATMGFDRRDGDAFPIAISQATEGNFIDGWDMMKARVSGTSVTLSWSEGNRPYQICIDLGENNWDIRDVDSSATSETIDISGRDNWYIEAKYGNPGNDFDNFGPTEENPTIVQIATMGFDRRDGDAFPIAISQATEGNFIDGWDMMKARVSGTAVTLSWSEGNRPYQICIELGENNWDIRDVGSSATSETIDISGRDNWYIEAKYGNPGGGNHNIDVDFLPDLSSLPIDYSRLSFDVEGRRDDGSSFGIDGGHYEFGKSDNDPHKTLNLSISDDAVSLCFKLQTAGKKVVSASYKVNGNTQNLSEDDIYYLTSNEGCFTIPVTDSGAWIELVEFSVKLENDDQGSGNSHTIGVDFLPDLSSLPGDDDANLSFDIEGRQSDNGRINLANGHYDFSKSNSGQHVFTLSVPENATSLGFSLQTAGKKVVSASYDIGGNSHALSADDINALTSNEGCFKIPVVEGETWIEMIVFSVTLENDDQGGGGQGGDMDVTYSEATTLSENTTKNDVKVENATLTIGENCSLRIDHRLDVEGTGAIVGTSNTSKLVFTKGAFSYGLDLYCNDEKISGGPTNSFDNRSEGPSEFTWDSSSNRWVTDNDPTGGGGTDAPWYTVSYGNSANLTTKNGQVYAERVHVNGKTYTAIASEYNASDSDEIYSMPDTIFHRKNEEVESENWDPMERYGIGGSDGDIMIRNDVTGVSIDFKFIPDFGYQLKNIYTNENEQDTLMSKFNAQETVSSFKFDVKKGDNVHFIVKFVEANNTVTGNAGLASTAKITSADAASSGTLEMTVDTSTPNSNIPEGSEALAAYDITLKNVVSKGEGRGNWETSMTDLGANNVTVTLPVDDTTNYTYSVIREHDGVSETLETTVSADGISFETNKFSTYTIVRKPETKDPEDPVDPEDPEDPEDPVDPEDPEDPVDPEDPANPVDPEDPEDPVNPVDPEDPVDPLNPEDPVEPTAPVNPQPAAVVDNSVASMVGGAKVENWNDLSTFLSTPTSVIEEEVPLELVIRGIDPVLPEEVFKALTKSEAGSLHLHLGKGTAINFANNSRLNSQEEVNLKAVITEEESLKTIKFESYDALKAIVGIHSLVPAGTKKVKVYYTDMLGKRTFIGECKPTEEGRFCFAIDKLGMFEIEY